MGGFQNVHAADADVQNIIDQVKPYVESQIGDVGEYRAISYKSQVVAGMNYKVKTHICGENYIHLQIYVPLPHTAQPPQLTSILVGKTENDPID